MARSFTLIQLRYFMEVARLENMRAAAQSMNVTQSTLSAAVNQLETDLEVALFHRMSNRGLRLTEEGKRLVVGARSLLEEAELLQATVSGQSQQLTGNLRVGIFAPIAPFIAPILLKGFTKAFPGISLSFIEASQQVLLTALQRGECEIALMYDLGVGAEFSMLPVERIGAHIILDEGHRLADPAQPIHLSQLKDEPFVLLDQEHSREYFLRIFSSLSIRPNIRYLVTGYETVRSYVAMGLGYSILNRKLGHDVTYTGKTVVRVPIADPVQPIDIVVVSARDQPMSRKAQAFSEFAIVSLSGLDTV